MDHWFKIFYKQGLWMCLVHVVLYWKEIRTWCLYNSIFYDVRNKATGKTCFGLWKLTLVSSIVVVWLFVFMIWAVACIQGGVTNCFWKVPPYRHFWHLQSHSLLYCTCIFIRSNTGEIKKGNSLITTTVTLDCMLGCFFRCVKSSRFSRLKKSAEIKLRSSKNPVF